ncbi:MAG: P-II family nitrogen regulator [Eubacteriaceae bacterium]|nr:P-II family nitrogen regulator [Eubacteriaceae bacterium]
MKKIEAIIQPAKLEEMKEALNKSEVKGVTITQVMGCGVTKGWTEFYRGAEVFLNVLPKVMIMIVTQDDRVDEIINLIIQTCRSGSFGDGKIFVTDVERAIRIRSREEGDKVL